MYKKRWKDIMDRSYRESSDELGAFRQKKGIKLLVILFCVSLVVAGGIYYIQKTYTIHTVYVEGNNHYTQDEIKDLIMKGPLGNNSLYLSLKYEQQGVEDVPFVDAMNVSILEPGTIKITVYEKALAGYIKYLDTYMYFDKDGYVVESTDIKIMGIPQISGFEFDYVVLGKQLPVEDPYVFNNIMNITKLLNKYSLVVDKIYFNTSGEITMYIGDIKALLGKVGSLEDKIMRIPRLIEKLEGQKGTLYMENVRGSGTNVTFEPSGGS